MRNRWNDLKTKPWLREALKVKVKLTYEIALFILALIAVSTMFVDDPDYVWIDRLVWFIFFVDVSVRFFLAPKKWEYVRKNPLDVIVALPLDSIFQTARLLRLFRLLRVVLITTKFMKPIYMVIKENNLERVLTYAFLLIFVVSIPISIVEENIDSYGDAIWWSIVTMTTVGYGDISPTTGLGRTLAVVLMIVGIGLIGIVTASIASYFIGNQQAKSTEEMKYLQGKLNQYPEWTAHDVELMKTMLDRLVIDIGETPITTEVSLEMQKQTSL